MYIKYSEFTGTIPDGDTLLMSHDEFVNGGKDIINIPVTITPDGNEPIDPETTEGV